MVRGWILRECFRDLGNVRCRFLEFVKKDSFKKVDSVLIDI